MRMTLLSVIVLSRLSAGIWVCANADASPAKRAKQKLARRNILTPNRYYEFQRSTEGKDFKGVAVGGAVIAHSSKADSREVLARPCSVFSQRWGS